MRCAVLLISSLLAKLVMISVLLTRLKQTFGGKKVCLTKELSFRALPKVMKSVKKHISFDLRKSSKTSLTRLFVRFWLKQTFGGKKSV